MGLENLLEEKKSTILERWFDSILETYPADTRQFLKKKKNRFENPVAHEISRGINEIFAQITRGTEIDDITPFLDKVIRIRAVQDLSPSQALAFIFDLKRLVKEELTVDPCESHTANELWRLDQRIDRMGLLALDLYMQCREKLYELRVKEVKNRVGRLIERANMLGGASEKEESSELASTDNST